MYKFIHLLAVLLIGSTSSFAQSYTTYFTGSTTDIQTTPTGGVCMMGGATEHDEAMKWFLERADGGDILVLRASGSDGYNDYMYSELGIDINSVETIIFDNANAANESYIHEKISNAEAIWFAGGDQWDYISYWRNTAIDSLINQGLQNRNIVIGGTSAGMAILGSYQFSAQNGTVTSSAALANPYNLDMMISSSPFLEVDYMQNIITDTHYDDPNRKGRHTAFLARILTDDGVAAKGIACNEYTSVCIDPNGIARVYGDYPSYDEDAYFIQVNCELEDNNPETCSGGNPLDWNLGTQALKVYKVHGTNNGANTFDLNDWQTGSGGEWLNWYVDNGIFHEESGAPLNCLPDNIDTKEINGGFKAYPNPFNELINIEGSEITGYSILDLSYNVILKRRTNEQDHVSINTDFLIPGLYILKISSSKGSYHFTIIKK